MEPSSVRTGRAASANSRHPAQICGRAALMPAAGRRVCWVNTRKLIYTPSSESSRFGYAEVNFGRSFVIDWLPLSCSKAEKSTASCSRIVLLAAARVPVAVRAEGDPLAGCRQRGCIYFIRDMTSSSCFQSRMSISSLPAGTSCRVVSDQYGRQAFCSFLIDLNSNTMLTFN